VLKGVLAYMQVFEEMQEQGIMPTAVTYGCLLVACEHLGEVDRAFDLYREACERGITPTDECHDILIKVCATTGRCVPLHMQCLLVNPLCR
jgi:pentatricopeptide repeat protein